MKYLLIISSLLLVGCDARNKSHCNIHYKQKETFAVGINDLYRKEIESYRQTCLSQVGVSAYNDSYCTEKAYNHFGGMYPSKENMGTIRWVISKKIIVKRITHT